MFAILSTVYNAIERSVSRKFMRSYDGTDQDIRFNQSNSTMTGFQIFIEKMGAFFQPIINQASSQSWPVFVFDVLILLGAISMAWRVIKFIVKCTLTRVLVGFMVKEGSFLKDKVSDKIKTSEWYPKKQLMPPRFHGGDNIYGWLSTFERHAQGLNEASKLLELLN